MHHALLTINEVPTHVRRRTRPILASMTVLILLLIAQGAMEPSRVVPEYVVLETIKAGQPVDFDNCTIVGDLNLAH
jgi:hypothetical protein